MLRKIAVVLSVAAFSGAHAQRVEVRVDPRVELFSILFHLAGREEYNMTGVPRWTTALKSHFEKYRSHPAMNTTAALATARRVGFFVPLNLAVHVTMPPQLEERGPAGSTTSLHRTWTTFPDSTRGYLASLRRFVADARYAEFLSSQAALIDSTQVRMRRLLPLIDQEWLNKFWGGPPRQDLFLVPGLTTGRASYGVEYTPVAGAAEAYAIIGVTKVDDAGFPTFDSTTTSTILHEMNHPYVTPLVRTSLAQFSGFADTLYGRVAQKMRAQYYGSWDAVLNESLVRTAVVRYLIAHGRGSEAEQTIVAETAAGFVWTRDLSSLFADYERNRTTYSSFGDYMPKVVQFFREAASKPKGP